MAKKFLTWKKFDPEATEILPGMILRVQDTKDTQKGKKCQKNSLSKNYLVGNVNAHLGVCDDCTNFDRENIVEYATDFIKEMSPHLGPFLY